MNPEELFIMVTVETGLQRAHLHPRTKVRAFLRRATDTTLVDRVRCLGWAFTTLTDHMPPSTAGMVVDPERLG